MSLCAVALNLAGASTASAWWNLNWTKRVKLTLQNGGQAQNLVNFPVLVRLDNTRVSYSDTQNAGQDIRFVDADDATPLAYEIDTWNEAGSSYVWVNVPQIDSSSNFDFIWMYFGNPTAPDGQNAAGVWNGYEGVWHLREDPSGAAPQMKDSTANAKHGTAFGGMTAANQVSGQIGRALNFDGTDDYVGGTIGPTMTEYTLEAWLNRSTTAFPEDHIVELNNMQFFIETNQKLEAGTPFEFNINGPTSLAASTWYHTAFVQTSLGWTIYLNGQAEASGPQTTAPNTAFFIGAIYNLSGGFFNGILDEARISSTPQSSDWIRAQYLSMSDNYISYGVPMNSGVLRVKSGTYVGNSTDNRSIYVGFQPDLVIVDMDAPVDAAPNEAVIRTSAMLGDVSKDLDGPNAVAADKIQSLDPTGFTVGTDPTVNGAGLTHYWLAFQAAPGKLKVGSYLGDGVTDNRSIPGVGFQPEYVIVMPSSTDRVVQRSAAMPGDITYQFSSVGFADGIQTLEADGFQVGLDARVNASGVTYYYAAWNASPGETAVGVYTGDNSDPRDITGVGFFPEDVIVTRSGSSFRSTHKPASTGVSTDRALLFENRISEVNTIQALLADGFQVGNHGRVNSSTAPNDYYWIAFGPHLPQTNYRSIGTASNVSGTVSATKDSVVVTDLTATWQTANRGRGDRINIGGTNYTVAAVTSQTQLQLTTPFLGATGSYAYTLARQFTTLAAWEDCISFAVACPFFPVSSASLVADDRNEVGIAYEDSVFALTAQFLFDGSTTDPTHRITLTADGGNRHNGTPGAGVLIDGQDLAATSFHIEDSNVTVEWLEFVRFRGASQHAAISIGSTGGGETGVVVQNVLVHNFFDAGFNVSGIRLRGGAGKSATVRNSMVWDGDFIGIEGDEATDTLTIENCSVDGIPGSGVHAQDSALTIRNTIAVGAGTNFTKTGLGSLGGSNNTSTDATAPGANPQTGVTAASVFVAANADLHLKSGANVAVDTGLDLSASFTNDIDGQWRLGLLWDRGADERGATTAVDLIGFAASSGNGEVVLGWQTASELDNLGFHVYRAPGEEGPYARLTEKLIPGLGSSPQGARYRYVDSGLSNGTSYFYKLEDVETTGTIRLHGPVSATPSSSAASSPPPDAPSLITYGNPEGNTFRVLRQGARVVVLELVTEGFTAEPQEDGSVRIDVSGYEPLPGSPSVPVFRPWVEALSGRDVQITSVRASSVESFAGLRPSGAKAGEIVASPRGVVRARRGNEQAYLETPGLVPEHLARLLQVGFQADTKKAQVELAPFRWNGTTGKLLLARRLTVRLAFQNRVTEGRGRQPRESASHPAVFARLSTTEEGLHEVSYLDLFGRGPGISLDALRLSRQGKAIAYHVEPEGRRFGPGAKLYFVSEGPDVNPYGNELVYQLERGSGGKSMELGSAVPSTAGPIEPLPSYLATEKYEENHYYQAALLSAPDLWLWDLLFAPVTKSFSFHVNGLASGASRLTVWLQGVSDFEADPDHHLTLYVNGAFQGELSWDGKRAASAVLDLPAGALNEGENHLALENVGDTAAPYSMVMLDRFELVYPHTSVASGSPIAGRWTQSGTATVEGLGPAHVLDVTEADPRWLRGARLSSEGTVSFGVEGGHRYLAVPRQEVRHPVIRSVAPPRLENETERADFLVIGPSEFSPIAAPLLELRRQQGLTVKFATTEDIESEFGFGESRPEAIREFIQYVYEHWREPKLRYVLLLGDATYDFKDYLHTGVRNQLPPLLVRTSYLWTASDPAYAAVHGDDILPDIAIGRLPAASPQELQTMVGKILAYETGDADLRGPVVLVTDNPDSAGDFDTHAEEIARGVLSGRDVRRLSLSELGSSTHQEILSAFDDGASLLSYIGHGGIHLWADENIFNIADVPALSPQSREPILLTMNCLNGYFHFPYFDSLAEALLKAEGKGAIAAFSPSGLSLDGPAHRFHLALLDALFNQQHRRLGDAVLAAQKSYADSGAYPELLTIYHLLGDPALSLR